MLPISGSSCESDFVVANAAEVSHDLAGRDRSGLLRECRTVLLDWSVEVQFSTLPKLHRTGSGQWLRDRRQAEQCVLAGGDIVLQIGEPETCGPLIFPVFDNRNGQAGTWVEAMNFETAASIWLCFSGDSVWS